MFLISVDSQATTLCKAAMKLFLQLILFVVYSELQSLACRWQSWQLLLPSPVSHICFSHKNIKDAAWHKLLRDLHTSSRWEEALAGAHWDFCHHSWFICLLRLCHLLAKVLVKEDDKLFQTNPLCCSWWLMIVGMDPTWLNKFHHVRGWCNADILASRNYTRSSAQFDLNLPSDGPTF